MDEQGECCYAVVFTAEMSADQSGYAHTARRMNQLALEQPGFIGIHHSMEGNREITISYWQDADSIRVWKAHPEHRAAQELGRTKWYASWQVRTIRAERPRPSRREGSARQ